MAQLIHQLANYEGGVEPNVDQEGGDDDGKKKKKVRHQIRIVEGKQLLYCGNGNILSCGIFKYFVNAIGHIYCTRNVHQEAFVMISHKPKTLHCCTMKRKICLKPHSYYM